MIERPEPPLTGAERETLEGFLDYHRTTLEMKCAGLTPEQLAARSVTPSTMSLLGLVRHAREVEYSWFSRVAGEPDMPRFYSDDDPDGDFDGAVADPQVVADAFAAWHESLERSRRIAAGVPDLEITFDHEHHGPMSLRTLYVHLIEEYARHNGHADLLRQAIDGAVGE